MRFKNKEILRFFIISIFASTIITSSLFQTQISTAQRPDNIAPPPPSVGAGVPLTYFGPSPSEVDPQLIGPVKLLKAGQVDLNASTITLPLYQGQVKTNSTEGDGVKKVWYVLTDTSDRGNAESLGLNWSPKLTYSQVGNATRVATIEKNTTLTFNAGTVDFKPNRTLVPGDAPNAFPPKAATAGSVGDKDYSPLVRIQNAGNQIYNAPIVAYDVEAKDISFCNGNPDHGLVHDKVVKICPEEQTVTLKLVQGLSFSRPVLYLSLDASEQTTATLEVATFAPRLDDIQTGHDDSAFSAIERLFAVTNGPTGKDNPQRQGLNSAIIDNASSPLNIFGGIPTIALDYSPLWDVNLGEWTKEASDNGYKSRLNQEFQFLDFVEQGWITGPEGKPFGSTGNIVNCPIVFRFL
ncbi:MAG: hypothetical protein H0X50_09110 [Nitrosopumilus sp.]|nr:hypothetical protein [Nitrosopumilus sp.]